LCKQTFYKLSTIRHLAMKWVRPNRDHTKIHTDKRIIVTFCNKSLLITKQLNIYSIKTV